MIQESSEEQAQMGPKKLGFKIGHISVALLGAITLSLLGYLLISKAPNIFVENATYGIYVDGNEIGTLSFRIVSNAIVENTECYVAKYSLMTRNAAREGSSSSIRKENSDVP